MVKEILDGSGVKVKVVKTRKSKFGDYCFREGKHRITINNDLNPYAFYVTLLHEIAHFLAFKAYKNSIAPHGEEWKSIYRKLLIVALHKVSFPEDVESALNRHSQNLKATTCVDHHLYQTLNKYDGRNIIYLKSLPNSTVFAIENGRIFKKEGKVRTRIRCIELASNKPYSFHPLAEVKPVNK